MKRATGTLFLIACLALSGRAAAQTPDTKPIFLDVLAGGQMLSPKLDTSSTFSLFGEPGSVATQQSFGGGVLAGARIGYRFRPRLAFALAISGSRNSSTGEGRAIVPSPVFVASPTLTNLESAELSRRETGYHLEVRWLVPVSDALEVSVFGGPSFIHLRQELMTVTPNGTQTVAAGSATHTGNAFGGHVGADAVRRLSDRFGVTVFTRYVFAKADLAGGANLTTGGLQFGGGLRIHF